MFKVYDDQRYFIKFAGAPTEQYNGNPADAIARLKATLPVYSELQHENLIFEVAAKAVSDDRNGRQQSIRQLREEWEKAIRMES